MVILRRFRVYRDAFVALAAVLFVVLLARQRALEIAAAADPLRGADLEGVASFEQPGATEAAPEGSSSSALLASSSASAVAPPRARRSGAEKVLVLGDSMVEVLSPSLNAYAVANGHELVPAIWYGSTTAAWARSPELPRLLREVDPTLVIVVLGASELTARDVATHAPFIRAIEKRVGARDLVWVGPPNWRADSGINDLLEAELGADRFFRSEHLELTRKRDGIHPDAAGGRAWTEALVEWLARSSRVHLELAPPSAFGPPPPARVLGAM
ncbi:MAG: hypothetical protein U0414_12175 [Polyangiaceae bacterium]